jgi:NTP pyrophosphatase (non-canonical NTP hydrolase)
MASAALCFAMRNAKMDGDQDPSVREDLPMTGRALSEFQTDVDAWIQTVGGGYWSPHANLARIAEEVGELARLINHLYGPKPKKASEAAQELGEELADIIFAVICLANSQEIDLEVCLQQVIDKVWQRDRDRYIKSG